MSPWVHDCRSQTLFRRERSPTRSSVGMSRDLMVSVGFRTWTVHHSKLSFSISTMGGSGTSLPMGPKPSERRGTRTLIPRSYRGRRCRAWAHSDHGALHILEGRAPADPAHVPRGRRATQACPGHLRGPGRHEGPAGARASDRPSAGGAPVSGRGARPPTPCVARAWRRGHPRTLAD